MNGSHPIRSLLDAIAQIDEQALGNARSGESFLVDLEVLSGRELLIRALAQECRRRPEAAISEFVALRELATNTDRIYECLVSERSLISSQLSEAEMHLRQLRSFGESGSEEDLLLNRLI